MIHQESVEEESIVWKTLYELVKVLQEIKRNSL